MTGGSGCNKSPRKILDLDSVVILFSTFCIIKQTKHHYLWLSLKQQSQSVSVITDLVPLLPHPGAGDRAVHRGHCCSAPLPQWHPSLYRKLSHCLRKEAGSGGREAAGSQPIVQSSEPQPGLTSQVPPPCGGCLLPAPCLQTTEHLSFPHPLAGRVEVYFGFLTFTFPKVSLEVGLS